MSLPPAFLDELRARVPLSDVIGRHVRLTRAGREHKGLCPFHQEKTPSFTVNDHKGFFHCFGCGAHGDVIGFVMRHDRATFVDAVEQLAAQAGLRVPQPTPAERAAVDRRERLHDLMGAAAQYFETELRRPEGRSALDYLRRRRLDADTIERFRLGYAPADGKALLKHLVDLGFDEPTIMETGLARQPDDGRSAYAFFRDRVMFPVGDLRDRVVGFGGRVLEGRGPKYLNSPDGPLFHKGDLLYGLARARAAAARDHPVIVAEGYMDVIALAEAGFEGAVAPLGTALTDAQVRLLWQMSPLPVLCLDGDEAGRRAARRVAEQVLPQLRPDHSIMIAFLPSGEDPDSLLSGGPSAMRKVVDAARPLVDVLWEWMTASHKVRTPEDRAGLKSNLDALARRIADPTVRAFYLAEFRTRVDAAFRPSRPAARNVSGRGARRGGERFEAGPRPSPYVTPKDFYVRALLACVINHPGLLDEVHEPLALLPIADEELAEVRQAILIIYSQSKDLVPTALEHQISSLVPQNSLDRVLADSIYTLARFARRGEAPEKARAGWHEFWQQVQAEMVGEEIGAAGQELGRALNPSSNMRPSNMRLLALQKQRLTDDELRGDGDPSSGGEVPGYESSEHQGTE